MILVYYFFTFFTTLFGLLLSGIVLAYSWPLVFLDKYTRYKNYSQYIITLPLTFLFRLLFFMRLKVYGKEFVDQDRVTLYICNHQSYMDIPPLLRYSHATALSKKEVKWLPIIGQITYVGGGIFFDRKKSSGKIGVLKDVIKIFKAKSSLCVFPEGTRSRNGKLLKASFSILKICYKQNIPVVPACIEGTRHIMQSGRPYFKFFQKVVLEFTPPIYPKDFANESDFCNACWGKVKETHKKIVDTHFS